MRDSENYQALTTDQEASGSNPGGYASYLHYFQSDKKTPKRTPLLTCRCGQQAVSTRRRLLRPTFAPSFDRTLLGDHWELVRSLEQVQLMLMWNGEYANDHPWIGCDEVELLSRPKKEVKIGVADSECCTLPARA